MVIGVAGVAFLVGPAGGRVSPRNPKVLGASCGCNWDAQDGRWVDRATEDGGESAPVSCKGGATVRNRTGFAIPALIRREPIHWSTRGVGAGDLPDDFGSIIGYSAYFT